MAQHRHKRETNARRPKAIQVAAPIAIMATVSAVSLGVLTATPRADEFLAVASDSDSVSSSAGADTTTSSTATRDDIVSRSSSRLLAQKVSARKAKQEKQATLKAIKRADTTMWTTTDLNLWSGPEKNAEQVGLIEGVEKVLLTGRKDDGRIEVVVNGRSNWVTPGYFADEKPETGPSMSGTCSNGTSASGAGANIVAVHQVVCSNWPSISTYGTLRGGGGDHPFGRAVDIMVSGTTGWDVANFLRANAAALGISYVIHAQNIWSVQRSAEGWRAMEDRGSITANHYDHVHVSTY